MLHYLYFTRLKSNRHCLLALPLAAHSAATALFTPAPNNSSRQITKSDHCPKIQFTVQRSEISVVKRNKCQKWQFLSSDTSDFKEDFPTKHIPIPVHAGLGVDYTVYLKRENVTQIHHVAFLLKLFVTNNQ